MDHKDTDIIACQCGQVTTHGKLMASVSNPKAEPVVCPRCRLSTLRYLRPDEIEHRVELTTEYDVALGYCMNDRGRLLSAIGKDVERMLRQYESENSVSLLDPADYYGVSVGCEDIYWDTAAVWTACYYVTGSSEGYYVHVDQIGRDKRETVWIAKTLRGGNAGRAWCERMVGALSRIFEV